MIDEILELTPAIDFGFGWEHIRVGIGVEFTVWLNTTFNPDLYIMILPVSSAATVKQESSYQFTISYNAPGTYQLQMDVNAKSGIALKSNIITVEVV